MRIAVCLAGQPRTWKLCAGNTRRMFDSPDHHVDYFIHTWNENGSAYRGIKYEKLNVNQLANGLKKAYDPQKLRIESYRERGLEGFDSHRYSVCKALQLKKEYEEEQHFKYDWVFYTRLDFCRWWPVNYDKLWDYLPRAKWFQQEKKRARLYGTGDTHIIYSDDMSCYCLQDYGYFGLSEDMDVFANLYDDFNEMREIWESGKYNFTREYCAEDFIAFFFLNRNIEIMPGGEYWDAGAPVRQPLEKMHLDLSTDEGLQVYSTVLDRYGWYYTEETLYGKRGKLKFV